MIKYVPVLEFFSFFFLLLLLWMNPVGMHKYTLKPPVIQALARVGLHCTLSCELLVLDILIRVTFHYISLCSPFVKQPSEHVPLSQFQFWSFLMLTSSGWHLGLLSLALTKICFIRPPPLTSQPIEGLSCMSTASFDRPYSCCLWFNLKSLVTSKWLPYELLKWEWHVLLDTEILWGARLYCVTVTELIR